MDAAEGAGTGASGLAAATFAWHAASTSASEGCPADGHEPCALADASAQSATDAATPAPPHSVSALAALPPNTASTLTFTSSRRFASPQSSHAVETRSTTNPSIQRIVAP